VGEEAGRPVAEPRAGKRLLLLLDNAEHLLPEIASDIARLVSARGALVLVTSRERLQIQGEQVYPVPPMDDEDGAMLFRTRASALDPAFAIDGAVEELCRCVDNLPLALELAATRMVVFSPEQLLERLTERLDLLKGGRDADPRQQTLRATIEWSYELLEPQERRLLCGLSVFAGGCTYEAAESVCDADPDSLQSLLDKSLLRKRDTPLGPRYWMLETIREYAFECLAAGEAADLRRRHAHFYAELGESLGLTVEAFDPATPLRHDVALADRDNFRVALEWGLECDPRLGLRLAIALEQHWVTHNPFEGTRWYHELLARAGELPPALRAQALRSLGGTSELAGDFEAAERLYAESRELYERLGDEWGIVHLRHRLANCAYFRSDYESAVPIYEENLARTRRMGGGLLEAEAIGGIASIARITGDLEKSYELSQEGLELCQWRTGVRGRPVRARGGGRVLLPPGTSRKARLRGRRVRLRGLSSFG
jgi:predicted ATPase